MMASDGLRQSRPFGGFEAWPAAWRAAAVRLGAVWLALIVLFREEWAAMASQWWNSSTYTHILVVPAIVAWLTWTRAPQAGQLEPRPWWPGLIPFSAAAILWLLGDIAGLALASQAGAVAMLLGAALVLLGPKASAGFGFPLAYMAFLVPFGDELVPSLQMITATLTTALVELSGIPAEIDGVFIDTPAGLFEVAEACSGVKFLIAMAAFGVLAANVCFRSWGRRIAFMALALVLPILANGVRAWATIYVAQFIGAEKATGFDHLVYGWIFFALVMVLTIAISWRFFDRPADDPMIDADAIARSHVLTRLERYAFSWRAALLSLAALALLASVWSHAASALEADLPEQIALPEIAGWQRLPIAPQTAWEPQAAGAQHHLLARYRDADGRLVDAFVAVYAAQGKGREAGGFGEGALPPGGQWSWLSPGPPAPSASSERLLGPARTARLAQTTYRTGDVLTGSKLRLKLANIADRLMLRASPTTVLILSSEEPGAEATLQAFRASAEPLGAWMDRAAGLR